MDITNISFGNAAGTIKTCEQALPFVGAACTRVTVGSITIKPRVGNLGNTYYFDQETGTSYNSLGLPNPGINAVAQWLPELKRRLNDCGQELVVSVAGFSPQEYGILTGALLPLVDRVEENFGCGNMWGRSGQKPIPSYHPEILTEILDCIRREVGVGQNISAKISPIDDDHLLAYVFGKITGYGCIDEIIGPNTYPNQDHILPDGRHALAFRASEDTPIQHAGGKAGAPLKEHGLRVLRLLRRLEPYKPTTCFPIISVGGISTAQDAKDYLNAGATGFEVGTAVYEREPKVLQEIATGFLDL